MRSIHTSMWSKARAYASNHGRPIDDHTPSYVHLIMSSINRCDMRTFDYCPNILYVHTHDTKAASGHSIFMTYTACPVFGPLPSKRAKYHTTRTHAWPPRSLLRSFRGVHVVRACVSQEFFPRHSTVFFHHITLRCIPACLLIFFA